MSGPRLPKTIDPQGRMTQLLPRANDGDPEAVAALRATLDETPALWDHISDLAAQAEGEFLEKATGGNPVFAEAFRRGARAKRRALLGPSPSPLERLLVDRVVVCWLYLAYVETTYHQDPNSSWRQDEQHQRRIDRAQRRYLSSIRALATVRKLERPALHLNIADQQINVAQVAITGETQGTRSSE